jgi:sugar transferase (PEP-CTERM system associated)
VTTLRIFKHYIRVQFLILALVEGAVFIASVYIGTHIRFGGDFGLAEAANAELQLWPLFPRAMVYAIVMMGSMISLGLHQAQRREGFSEVLLRFGVSGLMGITGLSVIFYLIPQLYIVRGAFVSSFIVSFLLIAIIRYIFFNIVGKDILKRHILVFGAGARAASINELREGAAQNNFYLEGFVHIPGEHDVIDSEKVIHLDTPLLEFVFERKVEEVVIAVNDRRKDFPLDELLDCRLSGVEVIEPITFIERETGKVSLELLHPSWMIFSDGFQRSHLGSYLERAFDIVGSIAILAVTWPILVVTAVAIWLESGARYPIFYKQVRVGQNGAHFNLLKFRSMRVDAEKGGIARWASLGDDRVTRVGRIIRKYRIDELPQIINILRGDMSMVGPRPERPEFVKDLSEKIAYYGERHRVKPGLTGWAQMKYPYGSSEKDAIEKLQYDLYYVKNHSLFLDLYILLQTAQVILWGKGAR